MAPLAKGLVASGATTVPCRSVEGAAQNWSTDLSGRPQYYPLSPRAKRKSLSLSRHRRVDSSKCCRGRGVRPSWQSLVAGCRAPHFHPAQHLNQHHFSHAEAFAQQFGGELCRSRHAAAHTARPEVSLPQKRDSAPGVATWRAVRRQLFHRCRAAKARRGRT